MYVFKNPLNDTKNSINEKNINYTNPPVINNINNTTNKSRQHL